MGAVHAFPALMVLLVPLAQTSGDENVPSPYRGQEAREFKALSPPEVEGLLAGEGLGFARAAKLNGYPGPAHVLELSDELELDDAQLPATRAIGKELHTAAIAAGRRLVAAARELERQFASRRATTEWLAASLDAIAALRAELRRVHLEAHLRQAGILSPAQGQ